MKALIANQSRKFQIGFRESAARRREWSGFAGKARECFDGIIQSCKDHELFEFLYIHEPQSRLDGQPCITLIWGQHPTGYFKSKNKLSVEHGCALHFVQGVHGNVICILYPFESDLHKPSEKYLLFKIFKSPRYISPFALREAIHSMFSYAQVTSCFGNPDLADKLRIGFLRIKTRLSEIRNKDVLLAIVKHLISILVKAIG
jgi:hypothetical protein